MSQLRYAVSSRGQKRQLTTSSAPDCHDDNLQTSDAADGIRYAAGYLLGVLTVLLAVFLIMNNCAQAFTRTARSAMTIGGVSGSLRCAYSSGTVATFIGVGLVILLQAIYYLFMTLNRNSSIYSQYGNLCSSNGIFCAQTLAWQQLTGCVPIQMHSQYVFAKQRLQGFGDAFQDQRDCVCPCRRCMGMRF